SIGGNAVLTHLARDEPETEHALSLVAEQWARPQQLLSLRLRYDRDGVERSWLHRERPVVEHDVRHEPAVNHRILGRQPGGAARTWQRRGLVGESEAGDRGTERVHVGRRSIDPDLRGCEEQL